MSFPSGDQVGLLRFSSGLVVHADQIHRVINIKRRRGSDLRRMPGERIHSPSGDPKFRSCRTSSNTRPVRAVGVGDRQGMNTRYD
jgi:hypothetical protein